MNFKKVLTTALWPTLIFTLILLIIALIPFQATASAIEATSPRVNVLGLPIPEITGLDAPNSIIYIKANGYINNNADLVAVVSLIDENGNVIDTAEKKVIDPDNIKITFRADYISVGNIIAAKFTNHGIEGDGADQIHDGQNSSAKGNGGNGVGKSGKTKYIIKAGPATSPETLIVEKIIEVEVDGENNVNTPDTTAISLNSVTENSGGSDENTQTAKREINSGAHGITDILNTTDTHDENIIQGSTDIEKSERIYKVYLWQIIVFFLIFLIICILLWVLQEWRFRKSCQKCYEEYSEDD